MADINELEEQIAKLPIGYITKKVINEKKYYCQQWKENGKKKTSERIESIKKDSARSSF